VIDNIEIIKPLIEFKNIGDFYMLYILKRKKDQPEGERSNHQSVRTIKSYPIDSLEYLEKRYDEIKQLAEFFRARVYIHVQKQNHKDVSLNMISEIVSRYQNGRINQRNIFDSVVGKLKTYESRWIVDIDSQDDNIVDGISDVINNHCSPVSGNKIIAKIPTKSGHHLISHRFDVMEFKKHYPDVDVQKKNPTLLY
jgi:competence protein ComGF